MNGITKTVKLAAYLALGGSLSALVAGCTSPGPAAPVNTLAAAPVVTVTRDGSAIVRDLAPRKAGVYPSFSEPLTAANVQMSDQDAADQQKRLQSLAVARRSGTVSEAEYRKRVEELRKLAAEHGAATQAQITN